jgi:hypothetical protein
MFSAKAAPQPLSQNRKNALYVMSRSKKRISFPYRAKELDSLLVVRLKLLKKVLPSNSPHTRLS